ncbi:hypothetical protein SLE2022_095520 [Rubroshorea leprosula]
MENQCRFGSLDYFTPFSRQPNRLTTRAKINEQNQNTRYHREKWNRRDYLKLEMAEIGFGTVDSRSEPEESGAMKRYKQPTEIVRKQERHGRLSCLVP